MKEQQNFKQQRRTKITDGRDTITLYDTWKP